MLNSKLEYSILKDYFIESLSVEVSKYQSSQKDDETEKQIEKIIVKLHNILSRNSYNDTLVIEIGNAILDLLYVIESPADFNWLKRRTLYTVGVYCYEQEAYEDAYYYFSRLLQDKTSSSDTFVFDTCVYLSLMGYSDCMYPIMIWRVYVNTFQIELPQPKTSPIPHARNDFISTDITEGKSSVLKLVQGMLYVIDEIWFTLYITLDHYGMWYIVVSMINTTLIGLELGLVLFMFYGLCIILPFLIIIVMCTYMCACIMLNLLPFFLSLYYYIIIYIQSI